MEYIWFAWFPIWTDSGFAWLKDVKVCETEIYYDIPFTLFDEFGMISIMRVSKKYKKIK
jgi:hypothetical protein